MQTDLPPVKPLPVAQSMVTVRLTKDERLLLRKAARRLETSMNKFCLDVLLREAQKVVE